MSEDQTLQRGIAAARAGKKDEARQLLLAVIAQDEAVEAAWLWLSGVVDDQEEKRICLENVLTLNPENTAAAKGLQWLAGQNASGEGPISDLAAPTGPALSRPVLEPVAMDPAPPVASQSEPEQPANPSRSRVTSVEIEPYGCPYCGGPVSSTEPRCDHCRRLVALRYRKKEHNTGIGWLVVLFLVLALTAALEGYWVSQLLELNQLPQFMDQPGVTLFLGRALFSPEGVIQQARFAQAIVAINYILAGLCVLASLGLALRLRGVYYAAFALLGAMVIATLGALLVQLTGWLPVIARLALVVLALKFLFDCAPAFEWVTRVYSADLESGLKTGPDYHNRANTYYDMGMWAKAAAHWQVAARLEPHEVQYRADLANAYVKMGYPSAGLVEADRALEMEPDNAELRAFRDSLAEWEGSP
jgi:tetratricopeptide (TPR) repeat protein